jgi:hypothetical protein
VTSDDFSPEIANDSDKRNFRGDEISEDRLEDFGGHSHPAAFLCWSSDRHGS